MLDCRVGVWSVWEVRVQLVLVEGWHAELTFQTCIATYRLNSEAWPFRLASCSHGCIHRRSGIAGCHAEQAVPCQGAVATKDDSTSRGYWVAVKKHIT